jgi:hypothetical protein
MFLGRIVSISITTLANIKPKKHLANVPSQDLKYQGRQSGERRQMKHDLCIKKKNKSQQDLLNLDRKATH